MTCCQETGAAVMAHAPDFVLAAMPRMLATYLPLPLICRSPHGRFGRR